MKKTFILSKIFLIIGLCFISRNLCLDFYVDPNYVNLLNDNDGSFSKPFANMTFLSVLQMNPTPINIWLLSNITIVSNVTLFQMNVSIMFFSKQIIILLLKNFFNRGYENPVNIGVQNFEGFIVENSSLSLVNINIYGNISKNLIQGKSYSFIALNVKYFKF